MKPAEEDGTEAIPKNLGGRPPKLEPTETTFQYLRGLASIQATKPEVASVMGVTLQTLRKFFNEYPEAREAYEGGQAIGKISLRRRQWKSSEKSAQMQIWLGKQWLGQSDRAKHEHGGPNGGPIPVYNLSSLSDEEIELYERIQIKLAAAATAGDAGGDPGGEGEAGGGEEPI